MNRRFKLIGMLILPLMVLACTGESKRLKPVAEETTTTGETLTELNPDSISGLCDTAEEDLSAPAGAQVTNLPVEASIPIQDYVYVQCNGEAIRKRGPLTLLDRSVEIEPPSLFRGVRRIVNFVEVKNHRSCDVLRIRQGKQDDSFFLFDKTVSSLSRRGHLTLGIHNSGIHGYIYRGKLGVQEGQNLLEIKYYGKCLKYKNDRGQVDDDRYGCLEAEVLTTQWIVIDLSISKPFIDGVRTINEQFCKNN